MAASTETGSGIKTGAAIGLACGAFGMLTQCLGALLLEQPGERNEEMRRAGKELLCKLNEMLNET